LNRNQPNARMNKIISPTGSGCLNRSPGKQRVLGIIFACWTAGAFGQSNSTFTFSSSVAVPDGNPSGVSLQQNVAGMGSAIGGVTVSLDLSGGYNGDLYAYLRGPQGGFAVLLNRDGVTGGNTFGYADTGLNITLDDSAGYGNIHFYQGFGYDLNGSGQLTGTWASDGRAIDPQSNPLLFDITQPTLTLGSFNGKNANGTWTLFVADLSAGEQSTLVSWQLQIQTVPEPSTWALLGTGIFLAARRRLKRRR
jgi:subtilisin-like proprotein convertase family protein